MAKLTATNVINTALSWDGYCEKDSMGTDSQLKDKTWNAGYNNITYFWKYLDAQGYGNYQGQPWCDGWVDFCFISTAGGGSDGMARTKKCIGGFSAYTPTSAEMYRSLGSGHYISARGEPKFGDQIFFKDSTGLICHTGLVIKVTSSTVYTIEGNTSSAAGVVDNGGCVRQKSYDRSYSRIACYGRPKWEDADEGPLTGSSVAEQVYNWGIDHGYSPEAITGIEGNMKQESDMNPECLQKPTPYAAGIVQWERYNTNSGRFAIMRSYAEKKGKTWKDLRSQLEFMDLELSGGDVEYGGDGYTASLIKKYAGSYAKFKACTSVENAVKIFHDAFERSSQPMWEVRYQAANDFYNQFYKGSSSSSSSEILRMGDSGEAVKKMQQLLLNRGYDLGDYGADGDFGQATYDALCAFQEYHNLEVDGEYGPASRAILEQPFDRGYLQVGDMSEEVRTMQLLLLKAGYSVGGAGADGEFGADTETAVKNFQRDQGLNATGKYDDTTKKKLNAVVDSIESNNGQVTEPDEEEQPSTGPSTETPEGTYTYGMENDTIKEIQKLLQDKWKYELVPSGKFAQATLEAVVNFQTMHGLDATGKLDPTTMDKIRNEAYHEVPDNWVSKYQLAANINNDAHLDVTGSWNEPTGQASVTLKKGDSGSMVRLLQEILVTKFKRDMTISGAYDDDTVEGVIFVQYYYGLDENGVVTRPVWNVMLTCDYPVKA